MENATEQPSPHSPETSLTRVTVSMAALVLIMAAGLALNFLKPVWLTPPLGRTLIVYLLLSVAWIPALGVMFLIWPRERRKLLVSVTALAVLVGVLGCLTVIGSNVNLWLLADNMYTCEQKAIPPNMAQYTCILSIGFMTEIYTFEGQPGSPFMRLISRKFVNS